jgi:hypothetical protein
MRKKCLTIGSILLLEACSPPPSAIEIGSKYLSHPEVYSQLKDLIVQDTGTQTCFGVGTDNIGEYWEHGGKWNHEQDYDSKLELAEVLLASGLSLEKYELYLKLF